MQSIRRLLLILPVAVLLSSAVSLPVYARNGSDDDGGTSTSSNSGSGSSSNDSNDDDSNDDSSSSSSDDSTEVKPVPNEKELQKRGKDLVEKAKKEQEKAAKRSAEEREKLCKTRKSGTETRVTTLTNKAKKIQTKLDTFYVRAVEYKTANNVSVSNYDALIASIESAKAKAKQSVDNLVAVAPTIDCTKTDNAQELATYKAAVAQARTDLKAYKTSLRALFVALQTASASTSTEGTN